MRARVLAGRAAAAAAAAAAAVVRAVGGVVRAAVGVGRAVLREREVLRTTHHTCAWISRSMNSRPRLEISITSSAAAAAAAAAPPARDARHEARAQEELGHVRRRLVLGRQVHPDEVLERASRIIRGSEREREGRNVPERRAERSLSP